MVIGLVIGLAIRFLPPRRGVQVGEVMSAAGLIGLICLLCWTVWSWRPGYGAMTPEALTERFVFLVATATDVPLVQGVVCGVALWAASLWRCRTTSAHASRAACAAGSGRLPKTSCVTTAARHRGR
jgi:hypothetical protein